MSVQCVALTGDRCGEGAVWDDLDKVLYWCDINRFLVHRFDPTTGTVRSWMFDEPVVAVALTRTPGRLLLGLASRLIHWSPMTDTRTDLVFRLANFPSVRLNDGRPDPQGNFWIGSMQNNLRANGDLDHSVEGNWTRPGLGELFRFSHGGVHSVQRGGIGISNTVCWSPDGRVFYFGDSAANEICAFDFDPETSAISNARVFFGGFERGAPDGSTIDSEGYLWNCRFGGGCVVRVSPGGKIDRIVEMPCIDVTTCTFGGPDLKTLFITSAGMRQHGGERLAGSLFALSSAIPGLLEHRVSW